MVHYFEITMYFYLSPCELKPSIQFLDATSELSSFLLGQKELFQIISKEINFISPI